ncbi:hypothetical protein [Limosilactobacillus antri]|uniref:hypothetical protein n=1 Tax=Limosilactobacillus antri TaxID=227943 RepID=UPI001F5AB2B2|nr:hypothetical protein [Limosilactobacillus antri]
MELVEFITSHTQQIYDRIRKLYQLEKDINLDDELTIPELTVERCPPVDKNNPNIYSYNRDYYLWATRVTRKLLDVLNQLVLFYNASGFVNEDDYHDTSQIINWWIPRTLKVSSAYFDNLQSNYDTANKLLDELENYAEINR